MKKALIAVAVFVFASVCGLHHAQAAGIDIDKAEYKAKGSKGVITVSGTAVLKDGNRIYLLLRSLERGERVAAISSAEIKAGKFSKTWTTETTLAPGNYIISVSGRPGRDESGPSAERSFAVGTEREILEYRQRASEQLARDIVTVKGLFEELGRTYRENMLRREEEGIFDKEARMEWLKYWILRAKKTSQKITDIYGSDRVACAELEREAVALGNSVIAYHYLCCEKLGIKEMFDINDIGISYASLKDSDEKEMENGILKRFSKIEEALERQCR